MFRQAPLLGSLIEPVGGDLADPRRVARIEDSIASLVERMRGAEPERAEGVVAARGMADAAAILARRWVLQATNVPFLGRGRQDDALKAHLDGRFEASRADLATSMVARMRQLAAQGGAVASVTPQNWLFLASYKQFRETLLVESSLAAVVVLGEPGFDSAAAAGAFAALVILVEDRPTDLTRFAGIDASDGPDPEAKSEILVSGEALPLQHETQKRNPDSRIVVNKTIAGPTLDKYAASFQGIKTGDNEQHRKYFWELDGCDEPWRYFQSTVEDTIPYGGCESVL